MPRESQNEVLALLKAHDEGSGFLQPAALLQPGAQVGSYRIERIIGRGGMGVVYLAQDTRLRRLVALKALPPHLFRDDRMRARLRQEAQAAAALSHPSIATVYALEEIDGAVVISWEYLEGRTLRAVLKAGALTRDRALAIARDVGRALAYAHGRGVVHRDLKPENVIVTLTGAVKIVDFGLAQFDAAEDTARLTETGLVAGTPPYMSPEQLRGQRTDARTDQFAFGALLYELVTGRYAFEAGSLASTITKVLDGDIERGDLDDVVWSIITRATQKQADDRFPSMTALLDALGRAQSNEGTSPIADAGPRDRPSHRTAFGSHPGDESRRWWWEIHQLIVALAYWGMVWPAWHVHKWTGPYGVLIFLITIAIVIVGANVRFHLWFTSRKLPDELAARRADVWRLVAGADIAFALAMLGTGLTVADAHTGWGALFVSFGIGAAVSAAIIEPTVERAAFPAERAHYGAPAPAVRPPRRVVGADFSPPVRPSSHLPRLATAAARSTPPASTAQSACRSAASRACR